MNKSYDEKQTGAILAERKPNPMIKKRNPKAIKKVKGK